MWEPSQDMGWGRDVETKSGYGGRVGLWEPGQDMG